MGIWRKLPGIAGQWIFYTVLPCEFSHSTFLYSDSLKNNSWFQGDLFWLHMLVFWANMSLVQAIIWDAQWSRFSLGHAEKWPLGKLQYLVSHSRSTDNLFRLHVLTEISGLSHQLATSRFWNEAVTKIPSKCEDVRDSVKGWCENSLAAYPLPNSISRDSKTQTHLHSRVVYFHVTRCVVEWK